MAIIRWDPFREMDRILEEPFTLTPIKSEISMDLSVDVYEEKGNIIAEMNIAGMKPEEIDITVGDNYLKVTGRREEKKEEKEKNYYYKEIRRGSFERSVRLPVKVREDEAKATYDDGVLKIVIPKEEKGKERKKIQVEPKKEKK